MRRRKRFRWNEVLINGKYSRDIPSCLDYWFDVFHYKNKDYLAIYSTSFEIYEIKETPFELNLELINEFLIVPGCRVTVKAENNIVAISANDAIGARNANNLIYAIPYEVRTNKKSENSHHVIKMEKTCSSGVEVDQLLTLQPICIIEDMITSGVSISKTRIALLHCNGSISDLNYYYISNESKCALFENKQNGQSFKIPPKDYKELKHFLSEKVYPRLNKNELMESAKNQKYGMTLRSSVLDAVRMMSKILNQMKIFYGTKALWLPNTNFSKEKIDTDRITDRYVWKATRRRLDEHYSHPVALGRPTEPVWPGDYNRPIPDDNIQFEDESNSIAFLLLLFRKRPSHTDPT